MVPKYPLCKFEPRMLKRRGISAYLAKFGKGPGLRYTFQHEAKNLAWISANVYHLEKPTLHKSQVLRLRETVENDRESGIDLTRS
jgi:hypothetical protein